MIVEGFMKIDQYFLHNFVCRQTDRQTHRQTDRQTTADGSSHKLSLRHSTKAYLA